jgi:hypothetical protein
MIEWWPIKERPGADIDLVIVWIVRPDIINIIKLEIGFLLNHGGVWLRWRDNT